MINSRDIAFLIDFMYFLLFFIIIVIISASKVSQWIMDDFDLILQFSSFPFFTIVKKQFLVF